MVIVLATAFAAFWAGAPAGAVEGLVRVTGSSGLDSVDSKQALADCPPGDRVLGGGGYISGGTGVVHFTRLQALGSTDQFIAVAEERGNYVGDWRVYAYAICGPAPAGLEYSVVGRSSIDSETVKSAYLDCPDDKVAISYGARVVNGGGEVFLTAFGPAAGGNDARAIASEDENLFAGDWSVWTHAVCADEMPGQELVWADALPSDSIPDTITLACPAGKQVHGLGGYIGGGFGEVFHRAAYPSSTLGSVAAIVVEDANGTGNDYWDRVYAVCA